MTGSDRHLSPAEARRWRDLRYWRSELLWQLLWAGGRRQKAIEVELDAINAELKSMEPTWGPDAPVWSVALSVLLIGFVACVVLGLALGAITGT